MHVTRKLPTGSVRAWFLIGLLVFVFLAGQPLGIARAQASLSIEQITWSIIGLDAADVNAGPNEFPVGVRICNNGNAVTDADLDVLFEFTTANDSIALIDEAERTFEPLEAGECRDVYFWVRVTRNAASYGSTIDFIVTASSGDASVNTGQRLRVEELTAIGSNQTTGISGPTNVEVGQTYTWSVTGQTTAAGYPELQHFVNFCPEIFDILTVETTYSQPAGSQSDILWADGCIWDTQTNAGCTDDNPPTYGGTIAYTMTAAVRAVGQCTLRSVVYDFSNNDFHYNNDYNQESLLVTSVEAGAAAATATPTQQGVAAAPTATPLPPTAGPSPTPTATNTPGPSPTPTRTPLVSPTPTPAQLPETGSRLHPSQMLPSAPSEAPAQAQIWMTISIIVTLMMGVALAVWFVMMNSGLVPKDTKASQSVMRVLSVLFIVCALVLAGMLTFNLVRATQVASPPEPQTQVEPSGGPVVLYRPPEIPATRLIIPELDIDTELTEAPRLGSSWDVSAFFKEIAHLDGTAFPGTTGNAVLAGHINTAERGTGPFWNLRSLQPGHLIIAQGPGIEYRYKVEWVKVVEPNDVDVLEPTDEPVMTLISCSEWNAASWSYEGRIVVRAEFFDRLRFEIEETEEPTGEPESEDASS